MVTQHDPRLDATLRKSGCLFLTYLWAGWLWRAKRCVSAGIKVPLVVDDPGWVNATFGAHRHAGDVRDDAFVVHPAPIIRSGGNIPANYLIPVEETYSGESDHHLVLARLGTYRLPGGPFGVQVQHWKHGEHEHFVGYAQHPMAYFDSWIASQCVAEGKCIGLRMVTINSER